MVTKCLQTEPKKEFSQVPWRPLLIMIAALLFYDSIFHSNEFWNVLEHYDFLKHILETIMLDAMSRDVKSEMNSLVAPIQWEDSSWWREGAGFE